MKKEGVINVDTATQRKPQCRVAYRHQASFKAQDAAVQIGVDGRELLSQRCDEALIAGNEDIGIGHKLRHTNKKRFSPVDTIHNGVGYLAICCRCHCSNGKRVIDHRNGCHHRIQTFSNGAPCGLRRNPTVDNRDRGLHGTGRQPEWSGNACRNKQIVPQITASELQENVPVEKADQLRVCQGSDDFQLLQELDGIEFESIHIQMAPNRIKAYLRRRG